MYVIGIAGKARAGKDTIASWLGAHRSARVLAFADPIKAGICTMLSLPPDIWTNPEKKEAELPFYGVSPRYLAQTLGTQWGRDYVGSDVWVKAMEARIITNSWNHPASTIVIPDVRFDNEAQWVRGHGILLHVIRGSADGNVGIANHASELGVAPAPGDVVISNNGTIEELHEKLGGLFASTPV